jgi:hypothetical protein
MTSPLRRKRPTTAWSMLAGRALRTSTVAGIVVGLALANDAGANESASRGPSLAAATRNSGGKNLKWVPYRATSTPEVGWASASEPLLNAPVQALAIDEPQPVAPRGVDPMVDPFGDRKPMVMPLQPPGGLTESRLPPERRAPNAPNLLPPTGATLGPPPFQPGPPRGLAPIPRGAGPSEDIDYRCPSAGERDYFKRINQLSIDIAAKAGEFPRECSIGETPTVPRDLQTTFTWKASALCHKPLYFEDVQLERYGHCWGPVWQPFISAGRFVIGVPLLPYKMGLEPPDECVYALGYYRPGDCAPYMLDPLPLSVRGALLEAGAIAGAVAVLPP